MRFMTPISNRGILSLSGKDAKKFLQGLITNDINQLSETKAIYTAFLTPQGKFLHDFFITERLGVLFLEVEKDRLVDLQKRINLYKLKAEVIVEDVSNLYQIWAFLGEQVEDYFNLTSTLGQACYEDHQLFYVDPRCQYMGVRAQFYQIKKPQTEENELKTYIVASVPERGEIIPLSSILLNKFSKAGFQQVEFNAYDQQRLQHGLPDGSRDMMIDRAIPLECGLEDLHAISWTKGCYMGQELTARTKHRGLVRKRYFPIEFEGLAPDFGTKIIQGTEEVGEVYSSNGAWALARLKLEATIKEVPLMANHCLLRIIKPKWMPYEDIMKNAVSAEKAIERG